MRAPAPGAKTVVVVGAGLSGLSAAMHCAGAGYRVTLVEAQDIPGGRNGSLSQDGFRFVTGPPDCTPQSWMLRFWTTLVWSAWACGASA